MYTEPSDILGATPEPKWDGQKEVDQPGKVRFISGYLLQQ